MGMQPWASVMEYVPILTLHDAELLKYEYSTGWKG